MQEKPKSHLARAFGYFSLGLGISLLIGYWLKQEEQRNRQRANLYPPPAIPEEPVIVLSQKTLDSAPSPLNDNLTHIKGIGAKTAEALHAAGITSFAALAAAQPETLLEQLQGVRGISLEKLKTWIAEADQRTHD